MIEDQEGSYLALSRGKSWTEVGSQEKTEVQNLVLGLVRYQYHIHPRGPWSYNEDVRTMRALGNLISKYPSSASDQSELPIFVVDVIGDTILSSVSWIFGSSNGGFDFYDTRIVIFNVKGDEISVPAARVLSPLQSNGLNDEEQSNEIETPPRGSLNLVVGVEWWFLVPCSDGRWLHFYSQGFKFKGQRSAAVMTDELVTRDFQKGKLFVSLRHVDEVKDIVKMSTEACGHMELLS
jgi:hypothetical protein